jgi:hypothetical protein
VDQLHHPISQIPRKIRTVVSAAVSAQPPRHKHLRVTVRERQLHVGIGLVVPQQDVEARLALLDEVVLKRQRLVLIVDQDVVDVDRLPHQRSGFGVRLRGLQQVRPYPRAQVLGLPDVNHLAVGILVQIHAGPRWQCAYLLV